MTKPEDKKEKSMPVCGIVMPISAIDNCSELHWIDVQSIIKDCIVDANFEPNLVSDADDIGVIHKRIIQNLYENPMVVCDVSAKNPNVMFELGLRLAFDKPTIIVKDDHTKYTFDTSPIEHIEYPRDLRFNKIQDFKTKLTDKIKSTHETAMSDPNYSTFLKHFGPLKTAKLETIEASSQEMFQDSILEEIRSLRSVIINSTPSLYEQIENFSKPSQEIVSPPDLDICCGLGPLSNVVSIIEKLKNDYAGIKVQMREKGRRHYHVAVFDLPPISKEDINSFGKQIKYNIARLGNKPIPTCKS